jgi:hypothetical protein
VTTSILTSYPIICILWIIAIKYHNGLIFTSHFQLIDLFTSILYRVRNLPRYVQLNISTGGIGYDKRQSSKN